MTAEVKEVMEYLCIVALLFSAAVAQLQPPRQWQMGNDQFNPFGGPPNRPPMGPNSRDPFTQGGPPPPPPFGGPPNRLPMGPNSRDPFTQGGPPPPPPFGGPPFMQGGPPPPPMGGPMWSGPNMGGNGNTGWPNQGQMPPWFPNRPSRGPGNGNNWGSMVPDFGFFPNGPGQYPGQGPRPGPMGSHGPPQGPRSSQGPPQEPKSSQGPPQEPKSSQGPPPGPRTRRSRPEGPPRGRPNMGNPKTWPERNPLRPSSGGGATSFDDKLFLGKPLQPEMVGNREFIPIFQADNVTIKNVSGLSLKEGENIFLLPMGGRGPPRPMPYLKVTYNPSAKNSLEYGLTKFSPAFKKAEVTKPWEEKGQ
ncbi:basic salivary proline-rich protein 3 isoform X1 [Esox lucius]|uniref:basic salivary proline-rich protein 3 isoform X1 n=1 Tax=Esox lucius TaxID=8010 RepID=UPI001477352C|nr:basic salivary proline-rich protein 3 isoform X1 [Esox lucius]